MAYEQTVLVLQLEEGRRLLASTGICFFLYGIERAGSTRDPDRLEPNVHGKNYFRRLLMLETITVITTMPTAYRVTTTATHRIKVYISCRRGRKLITKRSYQIQYSMLPAQKITDHCTATRWTTIPKPYQNFPP